MKVKRIGVLAVAIAAAFLFVGAASAEMYVEGYVGGTFSSNLDLNFAGVGSTGGNLSTAPSVLGGVKLGTWFVPTGTLGYSYPDWMKYFGFYTDFSYQRLDVRRTTVINLNALGIPLNGGIDIQSEGMVATWAFMFAARYGFFQDSEVPFGRLQPYLAVGPAIMFSARDAKISVPALAAGAGLGNASSTNIALAAELGLRYMALKNVSFDISFKYRYANPSYNFSGGFVDFQPTYNLFSGQVGVAYHF